LLRILRRVGRGWVELRGVAAPLKRIKSTHLIAYPFTTIANDKRLRFLPCLVGFNPISHRKRARSLTIGAGVGSWLCCRHWLHNILKLRWCPGLRHLSPSAPCGGRYCFESGLQTRLPAVCKLLFKNSCKLENADWLESVSRAKSRGSPEALLENCLSGSPGLGISSLGAFGYESDGFI
jgi:hypothetical protein